MVSKKFLFGLLAISLVFGMSVIGCDPEGNTDPKSITITGISDTYTGIAMLYVSSSPGDQDDSAAFGAITGFSGNSATFDLYTDEDFETRFTGYGDYYVMLYFSNPSTYLFYTNGKTLTAESTNVPKYSIDSASSSIAYNKFLDVTDMMEESIQIFKAAFQRISTSIKALWN